MIYLTRLNHSPIVLNCELIEHVETTPDTVISLTTGQKLMVLESAETIVERVVRYRRSIHSGLELESCGCGSAESPAGTVTESGNHGKG
jgi:flagellar protein FlbD